MHFNEKKVIFISLRVDAYLNILHPFIACIVFLRELQINFQSLNFIQETMKFFLCFFYRSKRT